MIDIKYILYIILSTISLYVKNIFNYIILVLKICTIYEYIDYNIYYDDTYHILIRYIITLSLIKLLFKLFIFLNIYYFTYCLYLNIYLFIVYTIIYTLILQFYNNNIIKLYLNICYILLNMLLFLYVN